MTIEIFDKIRSKLNLRELGWTQAPVDIKEGTPLDFDIEDSFLTVDEDPEFMPTPKPNPGSEPE